MLVEPKFIETLSDLENLSRQLVKEEVLGVDIESDSLHHYFPKICLIQISTQKKTFIIDPLVIRTMDALRPLLGSHKIRKVFHGADYDLRSLSRDFSIKVMNLFDTMIASQFLGEKEPGLAAMLDKCFGILLDKKYQKANWSKRPLTRNMILYAAHDTAHLIRLYRKLERKLRSKGRLSWLEEECRHLSVECALSGDPGLARRLSNTQNRGDKVANSVSPKEQSGYFPLFRRFKGAGKMAPRDLAILENLLQFREREAAQEDRPPFRLFETRTIKELVRVKPTNQKALRKVPGLPAHFMKRYAQGALKAIRSGLGLPADRLPSYPKGRRPAPNPKKKARLGQLKTWREKKAKQLELAPGLICSNLLLDTLAEAHPKDLLELRSIPRIRDWQAEAFGQELVDTLLGIA